MEKNQQPLTDAQIDCVLNVSCYNVADILLDSGVELTPETVEDIPGLAYNLTVHSGMLPTPRPVNSGVWFGDFQITTGERTRILQGMENAMSDLRRIGEENSTKAILERLPGLIAWWQARGVGVSRSQSLPVHPETTARERRALEAQYLDAHPHPIYGSRFQKWELCWMANVERKQWERWRRGERSNNSVPGRKILALLERNAPARNPSSLRLRKKENWAH
jgi:hypothetical protein